jgi:hypothetical protein
MKHPQSASSRAVARSIPLRRGTADPLWVITIGMGAFFAIVAAIMAVG